MTTRIELRKAQQAQVSTGARSLGWAAGEMVVEPRVTWSPGSVNGGEEGWIQVDEGFSVRQVNVDGVFASPEDADLSALTNDLFLGGGELTISPKAASVSFWFNVDLDGTNLTIKPEFGEFRSSNDLDSIYVTTNVQSRASITQTITRRTSTSYEVEVAETLPTWGPAYTHSEAIYSATSTSGSRVLYSSFWNACRWVYFGGEPFVAADRLNSAPLNTKFKDLPPGPFLNFDDESTRAKESYPGGSLWAAHYHRASGDSTATYDTIVRVYGCNIASTNPSTVFNGNGTFYPQLTRWEPARTETRTSTTETPGTVITPPEPVTLSVSFQEADGTQLQSKAVSIPNLATGRDDLFEYTGTEQVAQIKLSIGSYTGWLRSARVPLPRKFDDATRDTYKIRVLQPAPIQFLGHAKPIAVPSNATVLGVRPEEFLYYSGTWDGVFKQERCRCPAWILYDVLTAERFGIQLNPSRIDANSFLEASKYCQERVGGFPRWSYDGVLEGVQSNVVETLLMLMRGWLDSGAEGLLCLKLERPQQGRWIVCPAVVTGGTIDYRSALDKPRVRCRYRDRKTGREALTPGTIDTRLVEVPWQDKNVVERWAKWETFAEQNLLDSAEFTLPWAYHAVGVGDLIDVFDPLEAGVRSAGRVISSNTANKWVQLDRVSLEYWPEKVASAQLIQQGRKAAIDQATWGYSEFVPGSPSRPAIRFQTAGGGYTTALVDKIQFKAGGRPEENRVWLRTFPSGGIEDRTVWAMDGAVRGVAGVNDIEPSQWRVVSISELSGGREFRVVCTRYIKGMHRHVELGETLVQPKTRWVPTTGTKLSQFQGFFDELTMRYPDDTAGPFDPENTMDGLTTSAL